MPKKVTLTEEQLADKFTAIAVKHLDKLSPDERERRIQAFEKRISGARGPPITRSCLTNVRGEVKECPQGLKPNILWLLMSELKLRPPKEHL
jgi:hypothetical protein